MCTPYCENSTVLCQTAHTVVDAGYPSCQIYRHTFCVLSVIHTSKSKGFLIWSCLLPESFCVCFCCCCECMQRKYVTTMFIWLTSLVATHQSFCPCHHLFVFTSLSSFLHQLLISTMCSSNITVQSTETYILNHFSATGSHALKVSAHGETMICCLCLCKKKNNMYY